MPFASLPNLLGSGRTEDYGYRRQTSMHWTPGLCQVHKLSHLTSTTALWCGDCCEYPHWTNEETRYREFIKALASGPRVEMWWRVSHSRAHIVPPGPGVWAEATALGLGADGCFQPNEHSSAWATRGPLLWVFAWEGMSPSWVFSKYRTAAKQGCLHSEKQSSHHVYRPQIPALGVSSDPPPLRNRHQVYLARVILSGCSETILFVSP